jgi:hypothetical protein
MAVIHHTTLVPTKTELLSGWLPTRPWYVPTGSAPVLDRPGGFRLDDPAGAVGVEISVVSDTSGDRVRHYHVPMTYRDAPLPGAEDALIGTTEHGVLGRRWVYDATRDPVFVEQLVALLRGHAEAQAQHDSHTPDPTVGRHASLTGPAADAPVLSVTETDTPAGTELTVGVGPAPGAEPEAHLVLDVLRGLDEWPEAESGDGMADGDAAEAGFVTVAWALADGTRVRARTVRVRAEGGCGG